MPVISHSLTLRLGQPVTHTGALKTREWTTWEWTSRHDETGVDNAGVDNVARRSKGGQRGSGEAWAAIKPGDTSTLTVWAS